jgi:hypothetical protein
MKELLAVVVATTVGAATFLAFGLYAWTAIHSGWSEFGLQTFHVATRVVPVLLGLAAGCTVYYTWGKP